MPKPIQNPRVGDALASEYNLVGRVRPVLDEVVVPTVTVGDVRANIPPKQRTAMAGFTQGAVAGQYCSFRLEVPPNGAVQLHSILNAGSTANLRVNLGPAQLTSPANTASETFLQTDFALQGRPAAALTYGTQAAAIAANTRLDVLATTLFTFPAPVVVRGVGGFGFIEFQELTVNQGRGQLTFFWTEYLPY